MNDERRMKYGNSKRFKRQCNRRNIEHCSRTDQAASFMTLMSDAFHLEDFEKAYHYYCDAVLSLNENRTLDEAVAFGAKSAIPAELVERAI